MAKDPAFLFYTSDFLTGTMFMSDVQVGKYMRLLCSQHQHGGYIDPLIFDQIVGDDKMLRSKFCASENGFFNERLFEEMQKRKQKSSKMSANAMQLHNKSTSKSKKTDAIAVQIENENEDVNEIELEKEVQEEKQDLEDQIQKALDPIYLEQQAMKWRQIDFQSETVSFIEKVRGSPDHYRLHGSSGLRLAFQSQLRNAKPKKKDGILKIIDDTAKRNAIIAAKYGTQKPEPSITDTGIMRSAG